MLRRSLSAIFLVSGLTLLLSWFHLSDASFLFLIFSIPLTAVGIYLAFSSSFDDGE